MNMPYHTIRAQLSDKAHDQLRLLADVPRQHHTSTARGLSWYIQHQLTHNSWHDTRPEYLKTSQRVQTHRPTNQTYWVSHGLPRKPRDLKLSLDAIIAAHNHCQALDLSPSHGTANALIGLLLEAWGIGHLSLSTNLFIPANPDINYGNRARSTKHHRANQQYAIERAAGHIERTK